TARAAAQAPAEGPGLGGGPRLAPAPGVAQRATRRVTRPFRFGSEDRPDPDPPLDPGALVGERYRVLRLLGEGGMGRVYAAEHTVLQPKVALKLLRRSAQGRPDKLTRLP